MEWSKKYGTAGDDAIGYVSLSKDGGYFIWGGLDTLINNTEYNWAEVVIKTDAEGEVLWRTFFNNKRRRVTWQLRELDDGNIVAIGEQYINYYGDSTAAWMAKLNSSGDVFWERFYVDPASLEDTSFTTINSFNGDFQQTSDGGFIIAGQAWRGLNNRPNHFFGHPWLVKLNSNGCLGPNNCGLTVGMSEIPIDQTPATIVAYPNPFTTQALISIKANSAEFANEKIQFQIFDVSGRLLQTNNSTLNLYGYWEFYVEREHYPAGIYFYQVTTQKDVLGKGKLIAR